MAIEDAKFIVGEASGDLNNEILSQDINPANRIINGSFESWSKGTDVAPDGWYLGLGGGTISRQEGNSKFGKWCARLNSSLNEYIELAQFITHPRFTGNKTFTFSCWVYTGTADRVRIYIFDYPSFTYYYSNYHSGGGWEFLTVTATISYSIYNMAAIKIESGTALPSVDIDGAMLVEGETLFAFAHHPLDEGHDYLNDFISGGGENSSVNLGDSSAHTKLGQSFDTGLISERELTRATVKLYRTTGGSNGIPGNVWLELYSSIGTLPSSLLATSGEIVAAEISTTATEYTFVFPRNGYTRLKAGDTKHLVIAGNFPIGAQYDYIVVKATDSGGGAEQYNGSTWSVISNYGLFFKTYYGDDGQNIVLDQIPLGAGILPVTNLPVGQADGVASLDANAQVPITQLPPKIYIPSELAGYKYRKSITINGSSDGNQTNYQMKVTIHRSTGTDSGSNVYVGSKCESNFYDIRFTTLNNTLLDYWIESIVGNDATIWVELDSIPQTGATFYMYYGYSDAEEYSNGVDTFPFFDDFSVNLDKWNTAGTVEIIDEVCRVLRDGANSSMSSKTAFGTNYAIRSKLKTAHFGAGSFIEDHGFVGADHIRAYYTLPVFPHEGYVSFDTAWENHDEIGGVTETVDFIQDTIRNASASIIWKVDDTNTIIGIGDPPQVPTTDLSILYECATHDTSQLDIDWCLIRKYTDNEPTWGVWGGELLLTVNQSNMIYGCRPKYFNSQYLHIEEGVLVIDGYPATVFSEISINTDDDSNWEDVEEASVWGYVYLIKPASSGGIPTYKLSITEPSSSNISGARYHPTQPTWRFVGSFYNDDSSDIRAFHCLGNTNDLEYRLREHTQPLTNGQSSSWADIAMTELASKADDVVILGVRPELYIAGNGTVYMDCAFSAYNWDLQTYLISASNTFFNVTGWTYYGISSIELPLTDPTTDANRVIRYIVSSWGGTAPTKDRRVQVYGYGSRQKR